jgi:predicted RNA polymerase sigma factor
MGHRTPATPARTQATADGRLVLLRDQDRSWWDRSLIDQGHHLVRACLRRNEPGPYQLQAAINAVHTDAGSVESTDWAQIVALYDQLLACTPTPVVALNRAIAVGEVHGPQAALDLVDQLDLAEYPARTQPVEIPHLPAPRSHPHRLTGGVGCPRDRRTHPGRR